jgi:hypothetical protein
VSTDQSALDDGGAYGSHRDVSMHQNEELGPFGLRWVDLLLLAFALILPLLFLPQLYSPYWAPKAVLFVAAIGPCLVALALLAHDRDRAAIAALGFLGWSTLSALANPAPLSSVLPGFSEDRTVLFLVGYAALWAAGRMMSERGRALLVPTLLLALIPAAVLGVLQVHVDLHRQFPTEFADRATGLFDNPVYFGALMAGATGLAAAVARTSKRWVWWIGPLLLFAWGVGISGSRVALAAALLAVAATVIRGPWRRSLPVVAAVALGLLASMAGSSSSNASSRVEGDISGGSSQRVAAWRPVPGVVRDHLLLGVGPGRFDRATSPHLGLDYAKVSQPDWVFFDAHNLPIELATTVGLVGLGLAGVWAVLAVVRARGPLLFFVGPIALTWLLQPLSVHTTVLAMLALGAAGPPMRRGVSVRGWRTARFAAFALGAIGVVVATTLAVAALRFDKAVRTLSLPQAEGAVRLLPWSAPVNDVRAQILAQRAVMTHKAVDNDAAIEAAKDTIRSDEANFQWWVRLGEFEGTFGDKTKALAAFDRAVDLYPWSEGAWYGKWYLADEREDLAAKAEALRTLCEIGSAFCSQLQDR